jgi:hypothetical protein
VPSCVRGMRCRPPPLPESIQILHALEKLANQMNLLLGLIYGVVRRRRMEVSFETRARRSGQLPHFAAHRHTPLLAPRNNSSAHQLHALVCSCTPLNRTRDNDFVSLANNPLPNHRDHAAKRGGADAFPFVAAAAAARPKHTMEHRVVGNMVFFSKEELENSPSREGGMSADQERAMRRQAQQIIIDVCQAMHV